MRLLTRLTVLVALGLAGPAGAAPADLPPAGVPAGLPDAELAAIGKEAVFWGMNQVGFYELRYLYTQNDRLPLYRGLNRLAQTRRLMTAQDRMATTVNASTLYVGGSFDVSAEPLVVELPAAEGDRYWSVQAADQYADWFFIAGPAFTGRAAARFLIVGPRWAGKLPLDVPGRRIVRAPSDSFTLTMRVAVTTRDAADFRAAHAVMDGFGAVPASLWTAAGGRIPPLPEQPVVKAGYRSFPRMAAIPDIARSMTAQDFYRLLSLCLNDPALTLRGDSAAERATLARLARIGLAPGVLFDPDRLTAAQRAVLDRAFADARAEARAAFERTQVDMNGWKLQSSLFYDDLDYVSRSGGADIAWGTPVPYPSHSIGYLFADSRGRPLDGRHRYTLTFDLAAMPPVTEFWELPVYDGLGYFVDNPIDRYSVTSYQAQAGVFATAAGRLTFHLQADAPADPATHRNWLPIPRSGPFQLAARFYGPTSGLLDGSYAMPALVRVDD